jgi:RNA polymerase-binding transcription factor DksA
MDPEALPIEPEARSTPPQEQPEATATETLDVVDADLRAVEAALGRLDAGSFGRCEVCGGDIDAEVLSAAPLTRACAEHAA